MYILFCMKVIRIDQYMKNFNENDVDDVDNIFNDDNIFPSIPL